MSEERRRLILLITTELRDIGYRFTAEGKLLLGRVLKILSGQYGQMQALFERSE
jgi:hypothetical protein